MALAVRSLGRIERSARLRLYDAVYVALALEEEQPLLTLDSEVVERATTCFVRLRVFGAE